MFSQGLPMGRLIRRLRLSLRHSGTGRWAVVAQAVTELWMWVVVEQDGSEQGILIDAGGFKAPAATRDEGIAKGALKDTVLHLARRMGHGVRLIRFTEVEVVENHPRGH